MTHTSDRQVIAYYGHHKCASTWIMGILSCISREAGMRHLVVVDELAPHAVGPLRDRATLTTQENVFGRSAVRLHVDRAGAELVSCLTADREQAQALRPYRGFHVIRDPRDIIVSAYFSHRNSHPVDNLPRLAAHRARLREVPMAEGLLLEMEHSKTELLQIGDWDYTDPTVLELKMEDLTRDPYGVFISIFRHLELLTESEPVLAREQAKVWMFRLANRIARRAGQAKRFRRLRVTGESLLGVVYANRFEANTGGRSRGIEDATSHYRKGVAGDWVQHFAPAHAEAFADQFGDLLVKLGYEADDEWLGRASAGVHREPAAGSLHG